MGCEKGSHGKIKMTAHSAFPRLFIVVFFLSSMPRIVVAETRDSPEPIENSFESMLKEAVSQRDHFLLDGAMHPVLGNLNEGNIERAVAIVEEHPDRIYLMHSFRLLAPYWARFDPEGALEYFGVNLAEADKVGPMRVALKSWARSDPKAAIAWVNAHALGKDHSSLLAGAVMGWALKDLPAAEDYVRRMPQGKDRDQSIRSIAEAQLHEEFEAFEKWVTTIDDSAEKENALAVATRFGRYVPELAFMVSQMRVSIEAAASARSESGPDLKSNEFESSLKRAVSVKDTSLLGERIHSVLEQLTEANLESCIAIVELHSDRINRLHAFTALVHYWAKFDPKGALQFSMENFTSVEKRYPMTGTLHSWAMKDPVAAVAWAAANAIGKYKPSLFQSVITGWALVDLPAATEYVRTMPPGIDREWSIRRIAKAHLHDGPEAFENWLATVNDPAERKIAVEFASPLGRFDGELMAMFKRLKKEISGNP